MVSEVQVTSKFIAGLAAGACIAVSALAPAAADTGETDDGVVDLVNAVAPDIGRTSIPAVDGADGSFVVGDTRIPGSGDGWFTVGGAAEPLSVSMPREADPGAAAPTADGSVVLRGDETGIDVVAQAVDEEALRIQTVVASADAPHVFTYDVANGYELTQSADGSFWAYRPGGEDQLALYRIHEPWARDAAGEPVETRYEIVGDSLVQTIVTDEDTQFPVVADPTWEWYLAAYGAGFNKQETRQLASAGAASGFCGLLPGAFAAACGVLGAQWFLQAQLAADAGECVFIAVVPAPVAVRYDSHNCT